LAVFKFTYAVEDEVETGRVKVSKCHDWPFSCL
jgi:hypothetical protein